MRKPPFTDAERILHAISEDDLQQNCNDLCRALGLPYYHTHDSRRSPEGFPDLVTFDISGQHLIIRELKTMTGKESPAQLRWLDWLSRVKRISAGVWRPDSWTDGTIERVLRGQP